MTKSKINVEKLPTLPDFQLKKEIYTHR